MKKEFYRTSSLIFLCAFVLAALIILKSRFSDETYTDNEIVFESVMNEGIMDDFSIRLTDESSLLQGNLEGFIYFGRDSCDFCRCFNLYLKDSKNKLDFTILKYDTDLFRESITFSEILLMYEVDRIPSFIYTDQKGNIFHFKVDEDEKDLQNSLDEFVTLHLHP